MCQFDTDLYIFVAMTYDLSNPYHLGQFQARANKLISKGAKVTLTEMATFSRNQNRYLHAIIGVVAMETGTDLEYAKRHYFKALCNREIFLTIREDNILGHATEDYKSITEVTQEEISRAIDRFKFWALNELGIPLPSPQDEEMLKMIEVEMGRCKYL